MMKLSTMQAVCATVDDQWESPLADELLVPWPHDSVRPKFWRASANFVFFFKIQGQDHVLRFNHASERSVDTIHAEIDYVNMLVDAGLRVAKPIRSMSDRYVESVSTTQGVFHTVVFEALPGKQLDREALTPDQFERWGRALGELHRAAMLYTKRDRPDWHDQLAHVAKTLPQEELQAHQALQQIVHELQQLDTTRNNFGLIHYDFELDNLIWDVDMPGMIDFDGCAWHWFAADIAYAVEDLFDGSVKRVDLHNVSFQQFMQGYRSVRSIEQAEIEHIPLFMRMQHLLDFAALERAVTPADPLGELPWMPALRDKLITRMRFYQNEFIG